MSVDRSRTTRPPATPGTGHGRISTETVRTIVESTHTRRTFWRQLALIGPAFVAGAWQFGPFQLLEARIPWRIMPPFFPPSSIIAISSPP